MRSALALALFVSASIGAQSATAAEVVVEMLNRDKVANISNAYKPGLVKVNKGDTVKWVATNPGHNVAFVQGGIPQGVALFTSTAQKEITFKFEKPGIYLYKCTPHLGLGMVGLVMVGGDKSNLAAVKAAYVPPLAKKRLEPLFAEIEAAR
ncbi:MAG: pseudoazurin [Alphaproteobacteria bacterium]|nr:pseudoazurin [Alphaproteobacteria bacterium]